MPIVLSRLFRLMAQENHSAALNKKLSDKLSRIKLLLDLSVKDIHDFHTANPHYGSDALDMHMAQYAEHIAKTLTGYFHSNGLPRFSCHYDKSLIALGSVANKSMRFGNGFGGGNRTRRQKKRR